MKRERKYLADKGMAGSVPVRGGELEGEQPTKTETERQGVEGLVPKIAARLLGGIFGRIRGWNEKRLRDVRRA